MTLNWEKILEHVREDRREEVRRAIENHYSDVVTTNWPVVEVEVDGCLRFKADPMTTWLADQVDLNEMVAACQRGYGGRWSTRRVENFYRGMGYSLSGFGEVFRSGHTNWKTRRV